MRCPPRNKWQINGQLKNNLFWMLLARCCCCCWFSFFFCFLSFLFISFLFDGCAVSTLLQCIFCTPRALHQTYCNFIAFSSLLSWLNWSHVGFVCCFFSGNHIGCCLLILALLYDYRTVINDLDQGRTCHAESAPFGGECTCFLS